MDSYRQTIDGKPEAEKTPRPVRPVWTALFAALTGALCAALSCADPAGLLLYPLAVALMAACLCAAGSTLAGLLPLLPAIAVPFLLGETVGVDTLALALLMPATGAAISLLQKRRLGGFYTAVAAAAAGIACLYAMVCLPGVLDGTGAFARAQAGVESLTATLLQMADPMRGVEEYSSFLTYYDELVRALPEMVPVMTTGVLCSLGALGGLLSTVLFFALTRKKREALGLRAPKPFRLWSIPKQYTGGIVLLYAMALLMQLFGYVNAAAVTQTVNAVLGFPLLVQGLSMIAFILSMRKYPSKSLNVVVFSAIAILFQFAQSLLTMLGIFEQMLRMRERALPKRPA